MIRNIFTNRESDWTIGYSMKRLRGDQTQEPQANNNLTFNYRQLHQFITVKQQLGNVLTENNSDFCVQHSAIKVYFYL